MIALFCVPLCLDLDCYWSPYDVTAVPVNEEYEGRLFIMAPALHEKKRWPGHHYSGSLE